MASTESSSQFFSQSNIMFWSHKRRDIVIFFFGLYEKDNLLIRMSMSAVWLLLPHSIPFYFSEPFPGPFSSTSVTALTLFPCMIISFVSQLVPSLLSCVCPASLSWPSPPSPSAVRLPLPLPHLQHNIGTFSLSSSFCFAATSSATRYSLRCSVSKTKAAASVCAFLSPNVFHAPVWCRAPVYMGLCVCVPVCVYIYLYIHIYTQMFTYMYVPYTCTYTWTQTYTYTHTNTYDTCIYILVKDR